MTPNMNITALEDTPILTTSYQRSAEEYYIKMDFNLTFVYPCIVSIIVNDDQQDATI